MGVINSLLCWSSRCCLFNVQRHFCTLISYVVVTTPHGGELALCDVLVALVFAR